MVGTRTFSEFLRSESDADSNDMFHWNLGIPVYKYPTFGNVMQAPEGKFHRGPSAVLYKI
jgi:hypothetical protein